MKSNFVFLTFLLCFSSLLNAQSSLRGKVTDGETGESLMGVKVLLIGTQLGAFTDEDGLYQVNSIRPGRYDIVFSYLSYVNDTVRGIQLSDGETLTLDRRLGSSVELDGVEISGERTIVSEVALLRDIQIAKEVVVGMSAEQIGKTQDRDASESMKRIPGVTVIDNRFVMVRGLSQRYNAVLLNGAFAPSIEPDVKSFSFDLIPTSAIDRLMIYKTPSADLPGEFAGGMIKIFTRNIPEQNSITATLNSTYRNGTTFRDFWQQENAGRNFFGLGTQGLNLDPAFPANLYQVSTPDSIQYWGRALPSNWGTSIMKALPDQRFQLAFNRRFELKDNIVLGNLTSLTLSNTRAFQAIHRYDFDEAYSREQNRHDTLIKFTDSQYSRTARLGALFNWALQVRGDHKIEFRNLFNLTTLDQTTLREGRDFDADTDIRSNAYYLLNRGILTSQLSGGHDLNQDRTRVEWVASHSRSFRNEPDFRRYVTSRNSGSGDPFTTGIQFFPDPQLMGRFFSTMKENSWFASAGLDQKLKIGKSEPHLLAGFLGESKQRDFNARTIGYYAGNIFGFNWDMTQLPVDSMMGDTNNINNSNGLKLGEGTKPSDSYRASNRLLCGYVAFDWKTGKHFRVNAGVRFEHNTQRLNSFDNNNDTVAVNNVIPRILPSFNLSWAFNEKMLLRATGGMTVNRPEFREIAPFTFFDFNQFIIYGGNPNLATPSIMNSDIRWELYPSPNEMITVGVFYKHFRNSIENIINPGSTSRPFTYTFSNAPQAYSIGGEVEVRKSLAFLPLPVVRDISVVANGSLLKSSVIFPDSVKFIDARRPLQGQSPYIVNAGLYYNNDSIGLQVNLLYNVIGKRISFVGFSGYDNIWEMPRNLLDLSITKRVGKFISIRAGIQDILNAPLTMIQDSDKNGKLNRNSPDQIISTMRPGTSCTLGFQLKF